MIASHNGSTWSHGARVGGDLLLYCSIASDRNNNTNTQEPRKTLLLSSKVSLLHCSFKDQQLIILVRYIHIQIDYNNQSALKNFNHPRHPREL